jgi:hypothetical protein
MVKFGKSVSEQSASAAPQATDIGRNPDVGRVLNPPGTAGIRRPGTTSRRCSAASGRQYPRQAQGVHAYRRLSQIRAEMQRDRGQRL